jgi:hypothetical protein
VYMYACVHACSLSVAAYCQHICFVYICKPHDSDSWMLQDGQSCIGVAASCGHIEIVKYLCGLGIKDLMSLIDMDGVSPLGQAQREGHTELIAYLQSVGFKS